MVTASSVLSSLALLLSSLTLWRQGAPAELWADAPAGDARGAEFASACSCACPAPPDPVILYRSRWPVWEVCVALVVGGVFALCARSFLWRGLEQCVVGRPVERLQLIEEVPTRRVESAGTGPRRAIKDGRHYP